MKRVYNVFAILSNVTLQTTSLFTDAVINETLWQCVPLQRDRLLQLINGVELPPVLGCSVWLPKRRDPSNPGCLTHKYPVQ